MKTNSLIRQLDNIKINQHTFYNFVLIILFDISPSDPGVVHTSFGVVLLSSQASDPNLYPSPGPDQILVQK